MPVNDELWHHGVIGQKWGVRRYQNKDGSYTSLGREHYGIGVGRFGDRRTPDQLVRKTIPSGSTFYRIQRRDKSDLSNQNGGVYVYSKKDQSNLRSITPWLARTQKVKIGDLEEVELRTNRPMKIASQKDVDDAISEMFKKNKKLADRVVYLTEETAMLNMDIDTESLRDGRLSEDDLTRKIVKECNERIKNSSVLKRLLFKSERDKVEDASIIKKDARGQAKKLLYSAQLANDLINYYGNEKIDDRRIRKTIETGKDEITRRIAEDSQIQQVVYDILRDKGFTAMYDNNMINAGLGSRPFAEAHEPLILLDSSLIDRTGHTRRMNPEIVGRAENEFQKYVNMQQRGK